MFSQVVVGGNLVGGQGKSGKEQEKKTKHEKNQSPFHLHNRCNNHQVLQTELIIINSMSATSVVAWALDRLLFKD